MPLSRISDSQFPVKFSSSDAVGTIVAERPPHRSVQARLPIRLPPWMSSEKAGQRIGMQNARSWNPSGEDQKHAIPPATPLTAATQREPPQSSQALPEETQPIDVSRE